MCGGFRRQPLDATADAAGISSLQQTLSRLSAFGEAIFNPSASLQQAPLHGSFITRGTPYREVRQYCALVQRRRRRVRATLTRQDEHLGQGVAISPFLSRVHSGGRASWSHFCVDALTMRIFSRLKLAEPLSQTPSFTLAFTTTEAISLTLTSGRVALFVDYYSGVAKESAKVQSRLKYHHPAL